MAGPNDMTIKVKVKVVMDDEIKAGDMVEYPLSTVLYRVLATFGDWLWLETPDGSPVTQQSDGWRKVKTPTPCPEGWANVSADGFGPCWPTCGAADAYATPNRIGVLHLSPNGDCEFIRTEEL